MLNTISINLKTDIKTDKPTSLPITLMSQDVNNNQFILRFTSDGESVALDSTYTVEILTKFTKSGASRLTSAVVRQGYTTWEFDTAYIAQDETVYNYVYVRKSGSLVVSADANAFAFDVGLSEIDKDAGRVAEVYDENYQKHLDEFKENVNFEEIAQAEQARKDAETLREESYEQKVDLAIVEADVVDKVDNKVTELTPQINNLTAQLAQTNDLKADKNTVWTMGHMGQDVKTAMTGGSVAVVGENSVLKENIVNGQVVPEKLYGVITGKNLFDKSRVTIGKYIASTGVIATGANSFYSDYIVVNPEANYFIGSKGTPTIHFYDSAKVWLSYVTNETFKTPVDTAYIRISAQVANLHEIQLEKGTVETPYESYSFEMKSLKSTNIPDKSIGETKLKDDFKLPPKNLEKDSIGSLSENLVTTTIEGKYVDVQGVERSYAAGSKNGVTDFITVNPSETIKYFCYTNSGVNGSIYDASKAFIGALDSPSVGGNYHEMAMPENAAFIRLNYSANHLHSINVYRFTKSRINWLEVEETNLSQELREKINEPKGGGEVISSPTVYSELLHSASSTYIGDSITAGIGASDRYVYSYPVQLNKLLKMSVSGYINYGVSGTTVAVRDGNTTSFVERVAGMNSANKDIAFIMGGTNDFVLNVPLATLATAKQYRADNGVWNRKEFFGAYCDMVEMMKSKNAANRVVLLTPITEKDQETPNTYGKLIHYRNAVLAIAKEYKLAVIDLFTTSSIDATNPEHRILYIPDGIHPNDEGYRLITERVARFMTYEYSAQLAEYAMAE